MSYYDEDGELIVTCAACGHPDHEHHEGAFVTGVPGYPQGRIRPCLGLDSFNEICECVNWVPSIPARVS